MRLCDVSTSDLNSLDNIFSRQVRHTVLFSAAIGTRVEKLESFLCQRKDVPYRGYSQH